jgi:cytochrome c oxidase subunit 4
MAHTGHHITPKKTLIQVFVALVVLTILTVVTSRMNTGPFHVPLAIAIAVAKASLVVMVFMALKYDNRTNSLVFLVGTLFVIIFLAFTLFDTAFRGDLGNTTKGTIQDQQRQEEELKAREPDPSALEFNRTAPDM